MQVAAQQADKETRPEQQAASPGAAADLKDKERDPSGELNKGRERSAIRYNRRRFKTSRTEPGRRWATEADIKTMQAQLGAPQTGELDGETAQVVSTLQAKHGLQVDGKIGPKTEVPLAFKPKRPAKSGAGVGAQAAGQAVEKQDDRPPSQVSDEPQAAKRETQAPAAGKEEEPDAAGPEADKKAQELQKAVEQTKQALASAGKLTADGLDIDTIQTSVDSALCALVEARTKLEGLPGGDGRTAKLRADLSAGAKAFAEKLVKEGKAVQQHVERLANAGTVSKEGAKQPELPDKTKVMAWVASLKQVTDLANDDKLAISDKVRTALKDGVRQSNDAALTIIQTHAVISAREGWREGQTGEMPLEEAKKRPGKGSSGRDRTDLDDIFKDSGFSGRVVTTTTKAGKEKIADWCGMFVGAHLFRSGMQKMLRGGFLHTSNVLDFFRYQQKVNSKRVPLSIWAEGEWWNLPDYHSNRGSMRQWTDRNEIKSKMEGGGSPDIRPGDVILIDHSGKGDKPQHITMVESFDKATNKVVTIEGNCRGLRPAEGEDDIQRTGSGAAKYGGGYEKGKGDMVALNYRDLDVMSRRDSGELEKHGEERRSYKDKGGYTIFGVGRPSIVDFEVYDYASKKVPDKPPELKTMPPAEMRSYKKNRFKVKKS